MTLDEGIEYCENIAVELEDEVSAYDLTDDYERYMASREEKCASDYRQLASWLKALKEIWDSGDCNSCMFQGMCATEPKLGQMVRYNCYGYSKREVKADDEGTCHRVIQRS